MSRFHCLTSVLCILFFAGLGGSAAAADAKIGLIDTQKIMRDSKAAKKAKEILTKDLEDKRAQFRSEEDQARKLEEELKRDGQSMTPAVRQEKTEKLEKEVKELRRLKADLEEDFKKKDAELTRKLLSEIREIVNQLLKKEKFTLIVEKTSVVAADPAIDITDKVIRLYDER